MTDTNVVKENIDFSKVKEANNFKEEVSALRELFWANEDLHSLKQKIADNLSIRQLLGMYKWVTNLNEWKTIFGWKENRSIAKLQAYLFADDIKVNSSNENSIDGILGKNTWEKIDQYLLWDEIATLKWFFWTNKTADTLRQEIATKFNIHQLLEKYRWVTDVAGWRKVLAWGNRRNIARMQAYLFASDIKANPSNIKEIDGKFWPNTWRKIESYLSGKNTWKTIDTKPKQEKKLNQKVESKGKLKTNSKVEVKVNTEKRSKTTQEITNGIEDIIKQHRNATHNRINEKNEDREGDVAEIVHKLEDWYKNTVDKNMLTRDYISLMKSPLWKDWRVRLAVAKFCPFDDVLDELIWDSQREVRYYVAKNKNISEKALGELQNDKHREVRYAVAKSTNSDQILAFLSEDKVQGVRKAVAEHKEISNQTVARLLDKTKSLDEIKDLIKRDTFFITEENKDSVYVKKLLIPELDSLQILALKPQLPDSTRQEVIDKLTKVQGKWRYSVKKYEWIIRSLISQVWVDDQSNILSKIKHKAKDTLCIQAAIQVANQVNVPFIEDVEWRDYESLKMANWVTDKPSENVYKLAMIGYENFKWDVKNKQYLTVVDYSKHMKENRLYVINTVTNTVENAVVSYHGKWSDRWWNTIEVSNKNGSWKTTAGFLKTWYKLEYPMSWAGWRWLRLSWLEDGINDKAESRWLFIHPADGRTLWCIALPTDKSNEIFKKIWGESLIFSYYPDDDYFSKSKVFKGISVNKDDNYVFNQ